MITVFGSINMDLIATTARLPKPGETVAGTDFTTAAGGKGANQALAARCAGSNVRMVGAVGRDEFAAPALALLADAGTDLSAVRHVAGPTGTALILVGGDGENMITVVAGANGTIDDGDAGVSLAAMQPGDVLMLQLEVPSAAVERALTDAKARGVTTILNIAPLTDDAARLGRMADIVIANETEFERLAGHDGMGTSEREQALMQLHKETGQTLIVTLGADGVIAARNSRIFRTEGLAIEPVDTVGAGDTFCGYLAASLDQGIAFEQALRRAAVAGSLACLKPGAQPSIPTADEVERRI
ncbi:MULTISPECIES: ribokinase [Alphaproteobacteria]|uniref:Ribokinase n=2 Tax=Alphaproteobacteria TaxID=28211 RepID=A0A512HDT7_9HYPH|nr:MULTISPECIES: ribokinase [Alphaproteobacteria]GEO83621.1 ribokinase [Ciceribacter naphthalenivorans]GLR24227.1 ribokinase [Ciceribacter naphthalenivorans]GLT07083.1 ribokinase [Sphingomonas psychrolutea]